LNKLEKKLDVRLYLWVFYVEKRMLGDFADFPWDCSIGIKAKDADGETVEGQGDFS